uniref:C-type lectin domain-containing protein n=1 Tax=Pygocentrus nattereri TaxID=42514 RepID=A0AAR2L6I8_PYGNA
NCRVCYFWPNLPSIQIFKLLQSVADAVAEEKKEAVLRDPGWKSYGSRVFKFFGLKTTWDEAEKTCVRNNAHLASVHDEGEDNFIKRLIHAQSNQNQATWLGGYSSKTAYDRWYWTDGSHFDFADWYPGEPNGSGKCLQTNYYGNEIRGLLKGFHMLISLKHLSA